MEMMLVWNQMMEIYNNALECMPEEMVFATIGMSIDYLCAKTGKDPVQFAHDLAEIVEQVNATEGAIVI